MHVPDRLSGIAPEEVKLRVASLKMSALSES